MKRLEVIWFKPSLNIEIIDFDQGILHILHSLYAYYSFCLVIWTIQLFPWHLVNILTRLKNLCRNYACVGEYRKNIYVNEKNNGKATQGEKARGPK